MNKETDLFKVMIKEGKLICSGLNKDFTPYRIYEFRGKKFRLSCEVEE